MWWLRIRQGKQASICVSFNFWDCQTSPRLSPSKLSMWSTCCSLTTPHGTPDERKGQQMDASDGKVLRAHARPGAFPWLQSYAVVHPHHLAFNRIRVKFVTVSLSFGWRRRWGHYKLSIKICNDHPRLTIPRKIIFF